MNKVRTPILLPLAGAIASVLCQVNALAQDVQPQSVDVDTPRISANGRTI